MIANEGEYKPTQGLCRLPGGYPCSYFLAANPGEIVKSEVQLPRIPIPRTPVNKGKRKNRSLKRCPCPLCLYQLTRVSRGSSIRRLHRGNRRYLSDIISAAYSTVSLLNDIFLLLVGPLTSIGDLAPARTQSSLAVAKGDVLAV